MEPDPAMGVMAVVRLLSTLKAHRESKTIQQGSNSDLKYMENLMKKICILHYTEIKSFSKWKKISKILMLDN